MKYIPSIMTMIFYFVLSPRFDLLMYKYIQKSTLTFSGGGVLDFNMYLNFFNFI